MEIAHPNAAGISEDSMVQCSYENCLKVFKDQADLKSHKILVHSKKEKRFRCEICSTEFTFGSQLKAHFEDVHSGEKPFKCEICRKLFGIG